MERTSYNDACCIAIVYNHFVCRAPQCCGYRRCSIGIRIEYKMCTIGYDFVIAVAGSKIEAICARWQLCIGQQNTIACMGIAMRPYRSAMNLPTVERLIYLAIIKLI